MLVSIEKPLRAIEECLAAEATFYGLQTATDPVIPPLPWTIQTLGR
jgi:hypothetical protein